MPKDLSEDSCSRSAIGFPQNVLDVPLHRMPTDLQGLCDLFIGPAVCHMLDNHMLTIGQMKMPLGLPRRHLSAPAKFLH